MIEFYGRDQELSVIESWFKAAQKDNHIYAYEIKSGRVNRDAELNRLIGKAARLTFKSIKLHNPQITGEVLNLEDM